MPLRSVGIQPEGIISKSGAERLRLGISAEFVVCDFPVWYGPAADHTETWRLIVRLGKNGSKQRWIDPSALLLVLFCGFVPAQLSANMDFARHLYEGNQYALAFQEFRKHAADDPVAQHHMGLLYKQGNGVQRNFRRALTWFSRASGQGYSPSMVQLGHLFSREREFSTNYREAFKWYERAAKAGNAEGALALALMYWNGHGAEKDKIAGYAWLQIAADAGEAGAQRQLARVKAQMSESDLREAKILQRQVLEGGKSGSGAAEKH